MDEADLCQANGIQGYPFVFFYAYPLVVFIEILRRTLRVYRNGEYSEYTGPRKADGIISYMTK